MLELKELVGYEKDEFLERELLKYGFRNDQHIIR